MANLGSQGWTNQFRVTVARRLALRIGLSGLLLSALTLCVLIPLQRKKMLVEAVSEAKVLAQAIGAMYQTVDRNEEIEEASKLLVKFARTPGISFVNLLNEKGDVIYSTSIGQSHRKYSILAKPFLTNETLIVTHQLTEGPDNIGAVSIGMNASLIFEELNRFIAELALGFIVVILLLTLFVAWVVERMIGVRLAHLVGTISEAEGGSYLVRAKVDVMDEIGAVAFAFNKMLATITNLQVKDIEREQDLQDAQEQLSIKAELERVAEELRQSNRRLERRVRAQELLMDAAHHLGGTLNKEAVLQRLVMLIRDKLSWPDFAIFLTKLNGDKGPTLQVAIASGLPNIDVIRNLTFEFGEGVTGYVAQTGAPLAVNNLADEKRLKLREYVENSKEVPEFLRNGSMLSVPMVHQGRVVGVLDFFCAEQDAFDAEDVTLLHALGAQAAMALVNADLYEATLELAISDSLTGVMNRRAMERRIESEIARSQRFQTPLALLMIDVDHFKAYNDRMGHVLGDTALKNIANALQSSVRKVDGVARFGGEEFCIILPQTNGQQAVEVANKLCGVIRDIQMVGAKEQPLGNLTISVGVSVYPNHISENAERSALVELVHAADEALYQAKRQGRNQVVAFGVT